MHPPVELVPQESLQVPLLVVADEDHPRTSDEFVSIVKIP